MNGSASFFASQHITFPPVEISSPPSTATFLNRGVDAL